MLKAAENLILREIAGESVLVPVGEAALRLQGVISLSESGTLLWKRLSQECTREELIDMILEEYDIDILTAERDVDAFVSQMRQLGILEENISAENRK